MKTYVITGATSGIGKALTKEFAKENIVFAGYRESQKLNDLKAFSSNVIPFYIDMEKAETIQDAANFISKNCKNIDTLINSAGCVVAGAIENLDVQKIRQQFEINTFSHLDFSQRLLENLEGGKIINISSMASFGFFPFVAPYCASKRALDILFNSMSVEFNRNIKIISVKPGVIATPLWEKSIKFNLDTIENCPEKYSNKIDYLVKNARDNGKNGLPVNKVVDLIIKIDRMKNPKPSYTIGKDAKAAEFISRLPQGILNFLVHSEMRIKTGK